MGLSKPRRDLTYYEYPGADLFGQPRVIQFMIKSLIVLLQDRYGIGPIC
jgi:hypothetical protein